MDRRVKLLATTCKNGTYHLSDPDGVLLDIAKCRKALAAQ